MLLVSFVALSVLAAGCGSDGERAGAEPALDVERRTAAERPVTPPHLVHLREGRLDEGRGHPDDGDRLRSGVLELGQRLLRVRGDGTGARRAELELEEGGTLVLHRLVGVQRRVPAWQQVEQHAVRAACRAGRAVC